MRSWSLVNLNTRLERSVEPPLASIRSLDQEKVCQRKNNAEITDFNFKRNNTLTCSSICARSLLVSCPPGTMVSSYRRSSLSLLAATCSGCLFGEAARMVLCPSGVCLNRSLLRAMSRQVPCCNCSAVSLVRRAAICICCRCLTRLVFASECGFITSSIRNKKSTLFTKK